jgi:hypothetical protein
LGPLLSAAFVAIGATLLLRLIRALAQESPTRKGGTSMRTALLVVVLAASGLALCAAEDEKSKLPQEVFKSWIHSQEEDKGAVQTYRTKDFKFPASRGRAGFEIKKDGEFIDHPIAPADGNETVPGKWELVGEGKVKVTFPKQPDRTAFTLEIVSCDRAVLRVKRIEEK